MCTPPLAGQTANLSPRANTKEKIEEKNLPEIRAGHVNTTTQQHE
jgi:hypothetical protein